MTNKELMDLSPKGWRERRVSEVIAAGDIKPVRGIDWELVGDGDIGSQVLGKRDTPDNDGELIMTPRKRLRSKREEARRIWRMRVGNCLPVDGPIPP